MDLLSDVLLSLKVESSAIVNFELSAPWGLEMYDFKPTYCFCVVDGSAWIVMEDGEPVALDPGDTVLVPRGGPCRIASSPDAPLTFVGDLWRDLNLPVFGSGDQITEPLSIAVGGQGVPAKLMALAFLFHEESSIPLLPALPDLMLVRGAESSTAAWVQSGVRFLTEEGTHAKPGYVAMARKLSELMFQSLVRAHLTSASDHPTGWLRGLFDKRIGKALAAMHSAPSRAWNVQLLASTAGISRSAFAERFMELVGQTPMDYLTDWRMRIAAEALVSSNRTVSDIALEVGYQSEAAFREAFKRKLVIGPSVYRKRFRESPANAL